jgi:hypothetical protein
MKHLDRDSYTMLLNRHQVTDPLVGGSGRGLAKQIKPRCVVACEEGPYVTEQGMLRRSDGFPSLPSIISSHCILTP